MRFVVDPLAFVDVAVGVDKLTLSICLVLRPVSFVFGAVGPLLRASTVPQIIQPLTFINGSVFQGDATTEHTSIFIRLLVLHAKVLVRINAIVLIHHLIHASVEAIIDLTLILVILIILVDVAAHDGRVIVIVYVFLVWRSRTAFHLASFNFFCIVRAIAAVICTTSHVCLLKTTKIK